MDYLHKFPRKPLKKVFLVHGDPDQSEKLGAALRDEKFGEVIIPSRGNRIAIA